MIYKNKKMLLVTGVKYEIVDRDEIRYHRAELQKAGLYGDENPYQQIEIEIVRGTRFVNIRGEEITIGMLEDVQRAIGLPFDVFSTQAANLETQRITILKLRREIEKFKDMNFLARLQYLLTGIIK